MTPKVWLFFCCQTCLNEYFLAKWTISCILWVLLFTSVLVQTTKCAKVGNDAPWWKQHTTCVPNGGRGVGRCQWHWATLATTVRRKMPHLRSNWLCHREMLASQWADGAPVVRKDLCPKHNALKIYQVSVKTHLRIFFSTMIYGLNRHSHYSQQKSSDTWIV